MNTSAPSLTAIKYTVNVDSDTKVSKRGFFMAKDGAEKGKKKQEYVDTITIEDVKKFNTIPVYLVVRAYSEIFTMVLGSQPHAY